MNSTGRFRVDSVLPCRLIIFKLGLALLLLTSGTLNEVEKVKYQELFIGARLQQLLWLAFTPNVDLLVAMAVAIAPATARDHGVTLFLR